MGAVVLAPVAEELLFRALILNFFTKKMAMPLAIALQAVLFVALHNYTYQNTFGSNLGIVQGLFDATLYAMARYHTRSIYTPIAMHMTGNAIATIERFIL
jgi:membrane protease YdiL (CAAX protease family)